MPPPTADGFDPQARFVARDGVAYKDFAAYLVGRPDAEDRCNQVLNRLRKEGRSEAFCGEYRRGYDRSFAEVCPQVLTPHEAHRQAGIKAFLSAAVSPHP